MLDWDKSHPYDLDRTATVETQVNKTLRKVIGVGKLIGDARRAVDLARGKASERKVGSTLREDQRAITDAWQRVTNLRTTMLAGTGGILKQELDGANKVIAEFDREAEAYNAATG